MVRMRHKSLANAAGSAFEIILVNANDGTSSYQMIPGFFRFVCANGLFVGDSFGDVKVRHTGDAVSEVIEGAYTVLQDAPRAIDQMQEFKGTPMRAEESLVLAEAAHMLRFPKQYEEGAQASDKAPIAAQSLLRARRSADQEGDLWTSLNVIQENVIRGGINGRTVDAHGRIRRQRTRAVKGIDQNKSLNRAL
jgi:hypothetical protein